MMNWNNGNGFGPDDNGFGGGYGFHNAWAGGLMMLLLAIAFGLFVFLMVRLATGGRHRGPYRHDHGPHGRPPFGGPTPGEILDMRLAKGEISPSDYREAREALGLATPKATE